MKTLRILVTGGGSSGHISPALAVIAALNQLSQQSGHWQPEFLYLGGKRGLEQKLVEAAGVPFVGVETGKLRRYFSLQNFTDMLRVPVGVAQSLAHVRRFKPDVVLATGGYVAVPPVIAAGTLGVPVLIHEQTVQVGLANRIAARFASKIGLASELSLEELSPQLKAKAIVVGNPLRPVIWNGDAEEAKCWARFDAQDDYLPTLYVTGGSQGARVINRAVEAALPELLKFCRIIHQCGQQPVNDEQDYDRLEKASTQLSPELRRRYFFTRFVADEIKHVFALADLILGRAGAGTVNEVNALGKAAIYVPLVPTRGDEQTRNAKVSVDASAATIVLQSELSPANVSPEEAGKRLLHEVEGLITNRQKLQQMGEAAHKLAKLHAAEEMAQLVVELAEQVRPKV